ncbi:hypothetical protein Hanom_Chr05g00425101 [Helianthus anomalus]
MNKMWDTCQVVVQPQWIFGGKNVRNLIFSHGIRVWYPYPHGLTRVYKSWNNLILSFFSFKPLPGYVSFTNPSIGIFNRHHHNIGYLSVNATFYKP